MHIFSTFNRCMVELDHHLFPHNFRAMALPPGCPEGRWRFARFGALSSNWRDLFGKRAKRFGGLGKRQGAGPSNRVRAKRNASFPRQLMADRKHAGGLRRPGGGKGEAAKPPHGNASSRFLRRAAQRSPWSPGGALRRGPRGPFGIAAMRFGALGLANFQGAPRAPRG